MNVDLFNTISNVVITIGTCMVAIGGLGKYYFSKQINEQEKKPAININNSSNTFNTNNIFNNTIDNSEVLKRFDQLEVILKNNPPKLILEYFEVIKFLKTNDANALSIIIHEYGGLDNELFPFLQANSLQEYILSKNVHYKILDDYIYSEHSKIFDETKKYPEVKPKGALVGMTTSISTFNKIHNINIDKKIIDKYKQATFFYDEKHLYVNELAHLILEEKFKYCKSLLK